MGKKGEGYVVVQMVLFGLIASGPWLVGGGFVPSSLSTLGRVFGFGMMLLGVGLGFGGVVSLGDNVTALPRPKEDARMVEHGAYRLVRHPIYSGIIISAFGWAIFMNRWFVLLMAVVLFLFFDLKSRQEERWLVEKYAGYERYRERVKKLIPFVY